MWLKRLYWLISNLYYTGNIPISVIMVNSIYTAFIWEASDRLKPSKMYGSKDLI